MLYLFDGWNLLHAGGFRSPEQLVDALAGFVATRSGRGIVVFDGVGRGRAVGALEIRFAEHADDVLERLAVEERDRGGEVTLVSSDRLVRETAGQEVRRRASNEFADELAKESGGRDSALPEGRVEDSLDPETRSRLERWRRGGA
jgi:predicted RNA-binding protein with PIN domain